MWSVRRVSALEVEVFGGWSDTLTRSDFVLGLQLRSGWCVFAGTNDAPS